MRRSPGAVPLRLPLFHPHSCLWPPCARHMCTQGTGSGHLLDNLRGHRGVCFVHLKRLRTLSSFMFSKPAHKTTRVQQSKRQQRSMLQVACGVCWQSATPLEQPATQLPYESSLRSQHGARQAGSVSLSRARGLSPCHVQALQ